MRLLVDTHILLWHLEDNAQLSIAWSDVLEDRSHEKYCSIVSLWKIATKIKIGKLTLNYPLSRLIPTDFQILSVEMTHVLAYQQLPLHHRDPFDRMLIAQTKVEQLVAMTQDANFSRYDIELYK